MEYRGGTVLLWIFVLIGKRFFFSHLDEVCGVCFCCFPTQIQTVVLPKVTSLCVSVWMFAEPRIDCVWTFRLNFFLARPIFRWLIVPDNIISHSLSDTARVGQQHFSRPTSTSCAVGMTDPENSCTIITNQRCIWSVRGYCNFLFLFWI